MGTEDANIASQDDSNKQQSSSGFSASANPEATTFVPQQPRDRPSSSNPLPRIVISSPNNRYANVSVPDMVYAPPSHDQRQQPPWNPVQIPLVQQPMAPLQFSDSPIPGQGLLHAIAKSSRQISPLVPAQPCDRNTSSSTQDRSKSMKRLNELIAEGHMRKFRREFEAARSFEDDEVYIPTIPPRHSTNQGVQINPVRPDNRYSPHARYGQ
ncbi:hypothetical protein F4777DRAFT_554009 [Nemania sp. FL0916]|nr:hypothetical protein F4777DRAFT_554009 [Nemania sp. FL0916]